MATWQEIQQGIFAGESGGDYNALFGYQNRPGGIFSDVKVSEMSIADILDFTNPSGAYGQFVANTRPDPEMGVATPVGAYQVVGTTLRDAVKKLGIDPSQKFDKATQDRIGKYIFETQGAKAFAGYKGPKMDGQQPTAPQMQQMQQQPRGLMGILRDPRTRQVLSSFSRTEYGERLGEIAEQDLERQEKRQTANRTAAWLKTQPGGEPYAQAIESGMDARAVYTQYMREKAATGKLPAGENVQSSRPLPDGSGQIITMRDGSIVVRLISGETLSGPAATAYFNKSQERAYEIDRRSKAAETIGSKVTEDLAASKNKIAQARSDTQLTFNIIDEIINSGETLLGVTGKNYGALDPETTPKRAYLAFNQAEIDLINKIKKLKGDVGVQAYQSLRGAGAITKEELQTAIDGLTRLDRMQSATQLVTELNNLKTRLSERLAILESKAAEVDAIEQSTAQSQDFVAPLTAPQAPTAQQPTAPAQPTPTAPAEPSFTLQDMGGGVMKKVYK